MQPSANCAVGWRTNLSLLSPALIYCGARRGIRNPHQPEPAGDGRRVGGSHYKSLAYVERFFRSMKAVDIIVRPVFHSGEHFSRDRVALCMLAYNVE